jgi:hypothetical protein
VRLHVMPSSHTAVDLAIEIMQTFEVKILKTEAGVLSSTPRYVGLPVTSHAVQLELVRRLHHPSAAEPLQAAAHLAPARMLRDPRPGRRAHSVAGAHVPRGAQQRAVPSRGWTGPAEQASSPPRRGTPVPSVHSPSCRLSVSQLPWRPPSWTTRKGHWLLLAHGAHVHERRDRPSRGGLR